VDRRERPAAVLGGIGERFLDDADQLSLDLGTHLYRNRRLFKYHLQAAVLSKFKHRLFQPTGNAAIRSDAQTIDGLSGVQISVRKDLIGDP